VVGRPGKTSWGYVSRGGYACLHACQRSQVTRRSLLPPKISATMLITQGLRLTLPARILRLGLPLLPQPGPLQPISPVHNKRRPHRLKPSPRLPGHRSDDDARPAPAYPGCRAERWICWVRAPSARCAAMQAPAALLRAHSRGLGRAEGNVERR
jgi:hypothetical protein